LSIYLNWILLFGLGFVWGKEMNPTDHCRTVFKIVLPTAVLGYAIMYLGPVLWMWPELQYQIQPYQLLYAVIQTFSLVVVPSVVFAGAMVGQFSVRSYEVHYWWSAFLRFVDN